MAHIFTAACDNPLTAFKKTAKVHQICAWKLRLWRPTKHIVWLGMSATDSMYQKVCLHTVSITTCNPRRTSCLSMSLSTPFADIFGDVPPVTSSSSGKKAAIHCEDSAHLAVTQTFLKFFPAARKNVCPCYTSSSNSPATPWYKRCSLARESGASPEKTSKRGPSPF